jgi:transposase
MKRLLKQLARSLWRIAAPVRRPAIRKFDQHMMHLLGSFSPRDDVPANVELALRSVVRELGRLQIQIEMLQQQIDDMQSSGPGEALADHRVSVIPKIG